MRQYKDSGIERIGKIPEEWEIGRIKNNIVFNPENTNSNEELEVSYMPMECLRFNHIIEKTAKYRDVSSYTPFEEGDIVMAKVTPCYENGNIAIAKNLKNGHGYGTSEIFVIRASKSLYTEYLFYYLYTPYVINRAVSSMVGTGGLKRINPTFFLNTSLLIPPVQEQQRIANYLDEKCEEIDGLISLQEQMIAQLTDYKQSVITEAVTKGLNPDAHFVPSGIEWIGMIPNGWKIKRFKEIFRTGKGLSFTKAELVKEGIPVISYGQVHSKDNKGTRINDDLIRFIPEEITNGGESSQVHVGDFIFADTSEDLDGCGNCVYVDKEIGLYAGYHSVIATSKMKKSNAYLAYLFLTNCWRSQIRCRVSGIKVFSISQSIINQSTVILPTSEEQMAIVDYLDTKCSEIDLLIETKRQKIETLKVYKKSIIYEAVTGKTIIE